MDSFPKINPKPRKATPKAKPIVAYGVVGLLASVSVVTLAVLSTQRSTPKRKVAQVTRTPTRPATRKKSAGPRVAPKAGNSPVIPDLPNMQELLGDTLKRMPSVEQRAERPKPPQTPTTRPGPSKAVRPAQASGATEKKATAQTTTKPPPANTQRPDAQITTAKAASSLAAEYEAMIRDEKQRYCSEVYCSLLRFVNNGSITPQARTYDRPLKELVERDSPTVSWSRKDRVDAYKFTWRGSGVSVPLQKWQGLCGPTRPSPISEHGPGFDKWSVESVKTSHLGEIVELPFKCIDGMLYLIGTTKDMPVFGKIFDPLFVLVIPSAEVVKSGVEEAKTRFRPKQEPEPAKPQLSEYERGRRIGQQRAIDTKNYVRHFPDTVNERAAVFWFEDLPKMEVAVQYSDFARGYVEGAIEQWKEEGLPVLR